MQIKMFSSLSDSTLERKVNDFINNNDVQVVEIKFSMNLLEKAVMVIYEASKNRK